MPSTSNLIPPSTCWDVFLSFRGVDTRYTFTDHLYTALNRSNIRTFMDDPELRGGEVISSALLNAIHESKTYVVVFSENYASSSRCLDELLKIHECYKSTDRLILPIFYNIDPSVVHHQTCSFAKAFEKHQVRDMDNVDSWRYTLGEVAEFSGYHVYRNRSEANIINEVVDRILVEINPKSLNVAKFPVGIVSRVKEITPLLSNITEGIIMIGIYGMGGVGKTTLAKAVYNHSFRRYQGSCFLANVREVSGQANGPQRLQQQLIADVLKVKEFPVHNVDHGIELIRERLCSMKVLIVIDDLDNQKQLDSLVGPFASGSVIIVTTGNEDLLDTIQVEHRYRYIVNELDDAESQELFNKHAFGNAKPSNKFMVLSKSILLHAGGLPLALEVFGSILLNQSEVRWKWFVDKLQRAPNVDIQQKLMISFDALGLVDPVLQDIFLDIACFFIGMDKDDAVKILETCYNFGDHSIEILKKRCLITINDKNELSMHDLFQEVAWVIARNHSRDEPGKHSRLFDPEDIFDVLKKNEGTETIEGIMPRNRSYGGALNRLSLSAETFKNMRKLRFLYLKDVNITGCIEQTFENLRWLHWLNCPLQLLPSDFCSQKLVILELPYSKIKTMRGLSTAFEKLKILDISYSRELTTTPDFTGLPYLETLSFQGCEGFEEVDASIGSLVRLVSLDLSHCKKLKSLPDSICNLRALECLNIGNCSGLQALPMGLGNIECLSEFKAWGLTISEVPSSIGRLSRLVQLSLEGSKNLVTLPDTICNLRSLEHLNIDDCKKLELPDQLWKIESLRYLYANRANLRKLPHIEFNLALSLHVLELTGNMFTSLPLVVSQLSNLEFLYLDDCKRLRSITKLRLNLKQLWARGCKLMESLLNLSKLKQLEIMELTDCGNLKEIQGLEKLTSISTLCLGGCDSSFLASTFRESFFKSYSGFQNEIRIYIRTAQFPDWISHSSFGYTTSLVVPKNLSYNFLGMIMCFTCARGKTYPFSHSCTYFMTNRTSGLTWRDDDKTGLMVFLPKYIFPVKGDDRIDVTAVCGIHKWVRLGVHILYNPVYIEEETSYRSKRLKWDINTSFHM